MARPILVINPRSDREFVSFVEEQVRDGAQTPLALEQRLSPRYPRAVVRERGLSDEWTTWYVYREGAWIASET